MTFPHAGPRGDDGLSDAHIGWVYSSTMVIRRPVLWAVVLTLVTVLLLAVLGIGIVEWLRGLG